ncbi:GNAT family N-acetyltransferase [Schaalia sp. 19OD2882]|uniref:GNAT family N-acetyltransferase n=1 Tax=Schaalia sp. 19OD2882 TaxID=2794089 RepID=UPI001C1EC49C|nr:GNAT family protein [Schaalia sp. 19OD2882]QWW19942.1 GNAT family N-acetyltransferase [Schaalia sp. 19OD2882]
MSLLSRLWGRPRHLWSRPVDSLVLVEEAPVARALVRHLPGLEDPRELVMRPTLGGDHARVDDVRRADHVWLGPWEATLPPSRSEGLPSMSEYIRLTDRKQVAGEALAMMVQLDGRICGQFTLSGVQRGAAHMCSLGYWVTSEVAGRGLGATCAAMMLDLAIGELDLHRVEVCVRPENQRSLGLCRRLGLREEGLRVRYLHIAGQWADHVAFAADVESMPPGGWLQRLLRARGVNTS